MNSPHPWAASSGSDRSPVDEPSASKARFAVPARLRAAVDRAVAAPVPRRAVGAWVLVPLLAAVVQLVGTTAAAHAGSPGTRSLDVGGFALLAAGPLLLVARHRWPAEVLAAVMAVTLGYAFAGYPAGPVYLAMIVALFTAMVRGCRRGCYVALGLGYLGFVWLAPLVRDGSPPAAVFALGVLAWLTVLAALAEFVRVRRAFAAAEARRTAEEEAARAEADRRRAGEERLRIARELHDVLAHHISLMNVQASVGLELMDADPEQARSSLAAVKQASREALGELRAVLSILRGDTHESAPRSPVAGLDGLDDLVERTRATGRLKVTVRVEGTRRPLPAAVDLAAFRIVQEALTNVVRHSGARVTRVRLCYDATAVTVEVHDDGHGPRQPRGRERTGPGTADPADRGGVTFGGGGGNGLPSMRQRAAALGGRVEVGPEPDGGFRVLARLPVSPDAMRHDETGPPVSSEPAAGASGVCEAPDHGSTAAGRPADTAKEQA